MGSSFADGKFGFPFGPAVGRRYAEQGGLVPQGISAELIADKWELRLTMAPDDDPPPPRHCLEDMTEVAPLYD